MLAELRRIVGEDSLLHSAADLLVYEADALTHYRARPIAVVLPRDTEQVLEVVRWCHQKGVPFVPRGAGTGLSGGALPCSGGIVVGTARMRRILEVHPEDRCAKVEVGLVNLDLSRALEPHGFFYAPDPSSQSACTIGGNVAENSGGPHCMKYGMTTQHILGLTVVTASGERLELGGPETDPGGFDLTGLFVGSEGTFGIATEAWVKITRVPQVVRLLFCAFSAVEDACRAVGDMVARGVEPAALEMIDRTTIEVVEDSVYACGLPRTAGAVLLVELDGDSLQVDEDTTAVKEIVQRHGIQEIQEANTADERGRLWRGRKAAFGALGRLKPDLYVQDAVVPRSKLPEVLRAILAVADEHDVLLSNVFHAGDGNLHPNISYDGRDSHETERVQRAGERIMRICLDAGGALSGEHGIGREKRDFMPMLFSDDDLALFRRVRDAWNPTGLCNPDKVLPSPKVCREFRAGAEGLLGLER